MARLWRLAGMAAICVQLWLVSEPSHARVVAVVVGVNEYTDDAITDLTGAVNDANAVADTLRRKVEVRDADLHLLTSGATDPSLVPTRKNIAEAFTRAKADLNPEDTLLFYFAGHGGVGLPESGSCLLPADTDTKTHERRAASVISAPLLTEWLSYRPCRAQIIITDCCRTRFDDVVFRGPEQESPEEVQRAADRFAFVMAPEKQQSDTSPDRAVIYACSIGESAIESKSRGRGVFTSYLLEGLEGKASKAGKIVVGELFNYTARMMKSASMQTPEYQAQGTAGDLVLAVVAPTPGQDTPEGYLQQGKDLSASGDRDGAILALSAAIRLQPDFTEAYRLRAECRFAKEQYSLALNDAQAAVELEPRNAANHALLGNTQRKLKNYPQAEVHLSKAIELAPEPVAEYFSDLGNVLYAGGDYGRAVENLTKAVAINPSVTVYCSLCDALTKLERHQEALQAAEHAVELDPTSVKALRWRGDAYAKTGRYDKARADYDNALARDPKYALAPNQRAHIDLYSANYDDAIKGYTAAIELEPSNGVFRANRAYAYLRKRDVDRALADGNEAIALSPTEDWCWHVRGLVHAAKKNWDLAVPDFTKAIELDPKDPRNYAERAQCYFERKNWDAALMDRCRQIELEPDKPTGYRERGWVYQRKSEWDLSIKDFTRALGLSPKDHNAMGGRGCAYTGKGDNEKALSDLNAAITMSPKTAWYYYTRGVVYRDLGKPTEARADFHKVMGLDPESEHAAWALKELEALR